MLNLDIFDHLDFVVYASDMDNHDLVYLNIYGRNLFGIKETSACYGKCYDVLQSKSEACDFCTNLELSSTHNYTWRQKNLKTKGHYILKDLMIEQGGRRLRLECAIDISDIENDMLRTKASLEAERNMVACIHELSSCEDLEETIAKVLQTILDYYDGNRGYIFEFDWETGLTSNTFEKCNIGVSSEIDNLKDVPIETVCVWVKEIGRAHV